MTAHEDFFATRKSAAVLKHGILKRYPVVFASKTGKGNRVVLLDGYAGRGRYDDGQPGSPLLLSRCAEFVKDYRDVLCVFVEQDRSNFADLSRVLEEEGGPASRKLLNGSLDEHLPQILAEAKDASLFAFLDPFGPALDFNLVKAGLLGRPKWPPTEVLLHFSVLSVARMGSAVHKARKNNGSLSNSDRKMADQLDRFLGGSWWQDFFARVEDSGDETTATEVAMQVSAEYQQQMTSGTRYRALSFPVRPRPDLAPKYVLALFTANGEGAWHFANALGKAGMEWQKAWYEERMRRSPEGAVTLFGEIETFDSERFITDNHDRWVGIVERNIAQLLATLGQFVPMDHVPEVYGTTLGQANAPHVRAALNRLYKAGKTRADGRGDFWKTAVQPT